MSNTKLIVAAAALSGLLAGSTARANPVTVTSSNSSSSSVKAMQSAGVRVVKSMDDDTDKHACKGKNACKGKGGCKTGDNGCKGKNSCKGNGGCKTDGSATQPG